MNLINYKNRTLNRNRNIGKNNHNSIIFPNRSALVRETCERTLTTFVNAKDIVHSDRMIGIDLYRL